MRIHRIDRCLTHWKPILTAAAWLVAMAILVRMLWQLLTVTAFFGLIE